MKKLLTVGALMLCVTSLMANENVGEEIIIEGKTLQEQFSGLENEFQQLLKREQSKYNEEKAAAAMATKTLAKQKEMYSQLSLKVVQLDQIKQIKFYKSEYDKLAKKYREVLKELEVQMKEQQDIIDRFNQIEALRVEIAKVRK